MFEALAPFHPVGNSDSQTKDIKGQFLTLRNICRCHANTGSGWDSQLSASVSCKSDLCSQYGSKSYARLKIS